MINSLLKHPILCYNKTMNFVTETQSAWETILAARDRQQAVVLYGTGNGADRIVNFCEQNKVAIAGIFVSDEFCRGQSFRGHRVESYAQITERLGRDFLLVIAFASELPEVLNRFQELSQQHPTIAPHLGLYNDDVVTRDWLTAHEEELTAAYDLLADQWSKDLFQDLLNFKFSGKLEYLFRHVTKRQDDIAFLELGNEETYYDLGAYNGDTLFEAKSRVVAVEADSKNFDKLKSRVQDSGFRVQGSGLKDEDIILINKAIWKEEGEIPFNNQSGRAASVYDTGTVTPSTASGPPSPRVTTHRKIIGATTIDAIVAETGWAPTYIKMDLEGAEKEALAGGAATIHKYKPKLFLAGYHFDEDLFQLPLMLHQLNPDYKIYLRKHPYVPDWEINFIVK